MVNQELKVWSRIAACGLILLVLFFGCVHNRGVTGGTLRHDDLEREFILYEPSPAEAHSGLRPLLLVLHGGGGTHRGMIRLTNGRFHTLADRDGFFVVYPQGIDRSWNDGRRGKVSGAHRKGIDDVGFLRVLIEDLIAHYPIDSKRIFVTGISNGGLMSFHLGCSLPDTIRAIAPVTAQIPAAIAPFCRSGSTVSLAVFNGTEDPLVPFHGGQIHGFRKNRGTVLSTDKTIQIWRKRNRCRPEAAVTELPDSADDGTRVTKIEYARCDNESIVVLYRIDGGGHTWPGGRQYLPVRRIGRTTRDINGCDEIWLFFKGLR